MDNQTQAALVALQANDAEIAELRGLLGEAKNVITKLDSLSVINGRSGDYIDEVKAKLTTALRGRSNRNEPR
jgi:hypothetical protein